MLFTNKYHLPEPLVRACQWQDQSHNPDSDISCTRLIDAPLRGWLQKKYGDVISEDVSDRLWALYGTIAHQIVEHHGGAGEHVERTAVSEMLGWRVSAQIDYMKEHDCLTDYKFTSVWSTVGGVKDEWAAQVNIGLYLLRHDLDTEARKLGDGIERLAICTMFRDWAPRMADEFPQKVMIYPVAMWSDGQARQYISNRVMIHQQAMDSMSVAPPICSDHERWMRDFAVMKKGQKNAVKAKIKTRAEAEEFMTQLGCDYIREAIPKRCLEYCVFGKCGVCPWWDNFSRQTRETPVISEVMAGSVLTDPDAARKDGSQV